MRKARWIKGSKYGKKERIRDLVSISHAFGKECLVPENGNFYPLDS
jgi:hypothetical protein